MFLKASDLECGVDICFLTKKKINTSFSFVCVITAASADIYHGFNSLASSGTPYQPRT